MATVSPQERLVFCRFTQLSVLRLLTTPAIMTTEIMTMRQAWQAVDDLLLDPRIDLVDEPFGIESIFRRHSTRDEVAPKRWQDDYLIAFSEAANLTLITFDRALATRARSSILLTP